MDSGVSKALDMLALVILSVGTERVSAAARFEGL